MKLLIEGIPEDRLKGRVVFVRPDSVEAVELVQSNYPGIYLGVIHTKHGRSYRLQTPNHNGAFPEVIHNVGALYHHGVITLQEAKDLVDALVRNPSERVAVHRAALAGEPDWSYLRNKPLRRATNPYRRPERPVSWKV